jgi:Zn-dependent protease
VYVAIVGPLTNIGLAIVSALLLHTTAFMPLLVSAFFNEMLGFSLQINIILALFNMIPLPPLDGGRVAVGLLPDFLAHPLARLERYGFLILLSLLVILPVILDKFDVQFNLFNIILKEPYLWVLKTILMITGLTH